MEGTSSSFFPANYVTLKDLQERWIKRKQDEEDEAKLRRIRAEEETKKPHNDAEAKNLQPKSKNRRRSAKKYHSSPTAPASHSQGQKKGAGGERKRRNLANEGKANGFNASEGKAKKANEFNANEGKAEKAIDAKSETSTVIASRRRSKKRQSARSRIPASESDSMMEIAGKRKEKERKGFQIAREDRTEEIRRKVADLSISSGGDRRGGRILRGGDDRRRRGGATVRASAHAAGMVWVRKTTEG
ncbi:hypothetical protein M5K25_008858 [Dendrobium thyrsiflorum]|uniref:Uncharacterized protein n=1 Tax=Dendrobium thyrsiflorum TaxID=117978 RepID=A0ABD0V9Z2_DENTH